MEKFSQLHQKLPYPCSPVACIKKNICDLRNKCDSHNFFPSNVLSLKCFFCTIDCSGDHKIATIQSTVHFPVIKQIPRHVLCYSKADWGSISNEFEDLQSIMKILKPFGYVSG